ncbi:hypothetical protein NMY22_g16326 [Coprinellus aureogranulatus]|nr:hypothetical protein NMY22_g16326 [Coprinellus aureogranulatus]
MFQLPQPWDPLLRQMHRSSYATLAHISLNITTSLYSHGLPQGGLTIFDPYLGLCDMPLKRLNALETVEINLVMQGSLDVHVPSSFGSQWGALNDALATRRTFPKLRKVDIVVNLRGIDGMGTATALDNRPLTNLFGSCFSHLMKPQFQALKDLHDEGILDFSFKVNVFDSGLRGFAPI